MVLYEFSISIIKDHIQVKIIVIEMSLLLIFVMACLSVEEGHTPPGSPQGSKFLLKIIKQQNENVTYSLNFTRKYPQQTKFSYFAW